MPIDKIDAKIPSALQNQCGVLLKTRVANMSAYRDTSAR